jgi:hypothetical protein
MFELIFPGVHRIAPLLTAVVRGREWQELGRTVLLRSVHQGMTLIS